MATQRLKPLLKLRIQGPGVRSGAINVPDLIRICQATQDAVSRQAEAMRGGQSLRPGPKTSVVYEECTLELTGIEKGSTILPFTLAKPQQPLPMPEITNFGHDVVRQVATAVKALGSRRSLKNEHFEAGLLDSLRGMGEILNKGLTKIEWIVPSNGRPAVKATFDKRVKERVIERIKAPTMRSETVEGVLEWQTSSRRIEDVEFIRRLVNRSYALSQPSKNRKYTTLYANQFALPERPL